MWSSKVRSSQGCWTCRLRRKKCDETRPQCHGCKTLEITCYFDDAKPDWMDGGARQKEMADKVKRQVKLQANQRRERKYLHSYEMAASAQDDVDESMHFSDGDDASTPSLTNGSSLSDFNSPNPPSGSPPSHSAPSASASASALGGVHKSPPSGDPEETSERWRIHLDGPTITSPVLEDENDMNFIMIYLDHVFPFLFPYYRPSVFEGGRGWLLALLRSNKAVYHTALSLSSYFFSVLMQTDEETPCRVNNRKQLRAQQEMSLREMQKDMSVINSRGVEGHLRESIRVLNGIIQLLIFDVAATKSPHWLMHVDAAISLFQHVVPQPSLWHRRMSQMGYPMRAQIHVSKEHTLPWTVEQAALRTFGGSLFLIDVLAATAVVRRPLLLDYHTAALEVRHAHDPKGDMDRRSLIRFENLFGMQTWIIHAIGEIASLDARRRGNVRTGMPPMYQLETRAAALDSAIRQGVECIDGKCPRNSDPPPAKADLSDLHPMHKLLPAEPQTADPLRWYEKVTAIDPDAIVPVHTKIYAAAAMAYLTVMTSGWDRQAPAVSCPVALGVMLLDQLPSPVCLRDLAWPFCVIGCLAEPSHHPTLRAMVDRMGPIGIFGSVRTALEIMEKVWARSETLEKDWDIAACLQILGSPVLLL